MYFKMALFYLSKLIYKINYVIIKMKNFNILNDKKCKLFTKDNIFDKRGK